MHSRRCRPTYTQPGIARSSNARAADADDFDFDPAVFDASAEEINKQAVALGCVRQNMESDSADFDEVLENWFASASVTGEFIKSDVLKTDNKPLVCPKAISFPSELQ
jgi:hypothetical protein